MDNPETMLGEELTLRAASANEGIVAGQDTIHALLPDPEAMQSLLSENLRLRERVVSLSATLLSNVARQAVSAPKSAGGSAAAQGIHDAETCVRCAKLMRRKAQIAAALEIAGHQCVAEAVRIEARSQRVRRSSRAA